MRLGTAVLLLAFGVGAGGLSAKPACAEDLKPPPSLSPTELASERMLGNLESALMLQGHVLLVAPELTQAVEGIAARLQKASGVPGPVRVFIVNTPLANAWTCPNGDILVATGLLLVAENADELAVVLGHEMAHLRYHDGYMKVLHLLSAQKAAVAAATVILAGLEGGVSSAAGVLLASVPIDNPVLSLLYDRIAMPVLCDMAGRLVTNAGSLVAAAILTAQLSDYGQAQESRADKAGVRYAAQAGFDARRGSRIFTKLADLWRETKAQVKDRAKTRQGPAP
jgi:predicted Zn-dependent protease